MNGKSQRYAIVGMQHRERSGIPATKILSDAPPDAPIALVREADNRFDRNAVQVWALDGGAWRHVGYVPKTQNLALAQFIDSFGVVGLAVNNLAMDSSVADQKAVAARLHKGNNEWPLVEIV